jgi:hypothetical protein
VDGDGDGDACDPFPDRADNYQACLDERSTCLTDLDQCGSNLTTCETERDGYLADLNTCNDALGACQTDLSTCSTDLGTCEANYATCSSDLGTCETNYSTCSADLGTCETDLATCGSDLGTCQTDLAASQGDVAEGNAGLLEIERLMGLPFGQRSSTYTCSGDLCPNIMNVINMLLNPAGVVVRHVWGGDGSNSTQTLRNAMDSTQRHGSLDKQRGAISRKP